MQLLASEGIEGASVGCCISGLGLIPGRVERLDSESGLVIPHVGWNTLYWNSPRNQLGQGLPEGGDMYFVHSYAFRTKYREDELATCEYGSRFAAIVCRDACYGVQFHPEKSQRMGKRILENFLSLQQC